MIMHPTEEQPTANTHGSYSQASLSRVALPLGGIGSGSISVEGIGSFSQVSLRHSPQIFFEPLMFSAVAVEDAEGGPNLARVLVGPVPTWKVTFPWGPGLEGSGMGGMKKIYGFPHFKEARFTTRFPFATVELKDDALPLSVELTAWNPFIPGDADASSLPVAGLEYRFVNGSAATVDAVYSFHAENFMAAAGEKAGFCGAARGWRFCA